MIFQHTLEHVLAGRKTQTSRIWKDNYVQSFISAQSNNLSAVYTHHQKQPFNRRQYYVGQELSIQPARGTKGIARIRILELAKRDVREFTDADFMREGFQYGTHFFNVWVSMHDKKLHRETHNRTGVDYYIATEGRPDEPYTALVFIFELVTEQRAAA